MDTEWVPQRKLMSLAREIIRRDSTNQTGTEELASFVGHEFQRRGFEVSYQKARFCGASQANVVAYRSGLGKRGLLINTHLDTVATDARKWTRTRGDPFRPTLSRGRLYGLGAADTKAALAAQLVAIDAVDLSKLRRPLWFTGTYGEEMGLVGVQRLLRLGSLKPDKILNTEPTDLMPVHGNYGFRIIRLSGFQLRRAEVSGYLYRIHFQGRAAHSAVPALGYNAIASAWRWLRTQGHALVVVRLNGGTAPNIVAADCWLDVISPCEKLTHLKEYHGHVISRDVVSRLRACPELSDRFRLLPEDFFSLNLRQETSNIGLAGFNRGQFDWILSYRFAPGVSPDERLRRWKKMLRSSAGSGVFMGLSVVKHNDAFRQRASCALARQVKSLLREIKRPTKLMLRPGCTEAGVLAKFGADVLTIGPGEAYGNIHQPNESVSQKALVDAAIFYRRLIERLCV